MGVVLQLHHPRVFLVGCPRIFWFDPIIIATFRSGPPLGVSDVLRSWPEEIGATGLEILVLMLLGTTPQERAVSTVNKAIVRMGGAEKLPAIKRL
jgi:hypothetical protein